MNLVVVLVVLAVAFPARLPAETRPEEVLLGSPSRLDPVPWAGNRYATALFHGPAWLAMEERPEVVYGRMDGEGSDENLLAVRSRWFGFATESYRWGEGEEEEEGRRYLVVVARRIGRHTAAALSYAWHTSPDERLDALTSWDAGLAWRPHRRVECTVNGRNLARTSLEGRKLARFYEIGLRLLVRPRLLTLFAEARHFRGDGAGEAVPVGGVEFFPRNFLALRGRGDTEGNQGLGIEILLGTASIGFHYRFSSGEEDGSLAYVKLHPPVPGR